MDCADFGVSLRSVRNKKEFLGTFVPGSRERRVESACLSCVISPTRTLGLGAAFAAISGNAVVTRRVQDGSSLHTELHIPKA